MLLLRVGKLLFLETSVVGVELLGVLDGVEFLEPERAPTLVLVYPEFLTSMDPVLDIFSICKIDCFYLSRGFFRFGYSGKLICRTKTDEPLEL